MSDKKVRVLVITGILPVNEIEHKKDENDILLITEKNISVMDDDMSFEYFFCIPYSNFLLSLISKKWKTYYHLRRQGYVNTRFGKQVAVIGVLRVPKLSGYLGYFLFLLSWRMLTKRINSLITKFKPTVIHAHNLEGNGLLAKSISAKYNIPYIVTARVDKVDKFNGIQLKILNTAKAIIGLTPSHLRKLPARFKNKSQMIPHGVSSEFYLTASLNEVETPIQFITIARLLPYKNIKNVIIALSYYSANYKYHIYGRGPQHDELAKLIKTVNLTDKVFLHGYIDYQKVAETLRTCHLFVLPSFPETFGRVYIEAMASGLPIVACKHSGMDGIIENGNEGFLLERPDVSNIKDMLSYVFKDPNQLLSMGEKAAKKAKEFHWDNVTRALHNLYQNVSI